MGSNHIFSIFRLHLGAVHVSAKGKKVIQLMAKGQDVSMKVQAYQKESGTN